MDLIARFIWLIGKNGQTNLTKRLKSFGIGSGQHPVLMLLYQKDGLNQDEISRLLSIDKSATAKAVSKLVDARYVVRDPDPGDKRMCRIFLTAKARQIKGPLYQIAQDWQYRLVAGLSEKDKTALQRLLPLIWINSMDERERQDHQNFTARIKEGI